MIHWCRRRGVQQVGAKHEHYTYTVLRAVAFLGLVLLLSPSPSQPSYHHCCLWLRPLWSGIQTLCSWTFLLGSGASCVLSLTLSSSSSPPKPAIVFGTFLSIPATPSKCSCLQNCSTKQAPNVNTAASCALLNRNNYCTPWDCN